MPAVAEKVFDEALSLPAEARMTLVEKLLTSLNLPDAAGNRQTMGRRS